MSGVRIIHRSVAGVQAMFFRYDACQGVVCSFSLLSEVGEPWMRRFVELLRDKGLVTRTMDVDERPWRVTVARKPSERCWKCAACRRVDAARQPHTPNPPFNHADDALVLSWNRTLWDNPCEDWEPDYAHMRWDEWNRKDAE